jgi:hypothetical protein
MYVKSKGFKILVQYLSIIDLISHQNCKHITQIIIIMCVKFPWVLVVWFEAATPYDRCSFGNLLYSLGMWGSTPNLSVIYVDHLLWVEVCECLWVWNTFKKEKKYIYVLSGTRTNIVCLRRALPGRVNALGYLRVRLTTTLSQHPSVEAELTSHTPRKINDL